MHKISKFYSLSVDLPYVKKARITYSHLADFTHKTLLIDFHQPMAIHSTLRGVNENILTIGNHFSPPPYWIKTSAAHTCRADIRRPAPGRIIFWWPKARGPTLT